MTPDYEEIWTDIRKLVGTDVPALIYCEGGFDLPMGKTAHRLIQHGEVFEIVGVIDSTCKGNTVATDGPTHLKDPIPIFDDLEGALSEVAPEMLVIGLAPPGGEPDDQMIESLINALQNSLDIVSGLNCPLRSYDRLETAASTVGKEIYDIRVSPPDSQLKIAEEYLADVDATIVTVMGTDSVIGKGTITYELYQEARSAGYEATFVATGQTGIMCGSPFGIASDKLPVEYAVGTLQRVIKGASRSHDLIFVEGQAALTHPRYVADDILKGSCPDAVVLADDPERQHYKDTDIPMAGAEKEREVIEMVSNAPVVTVGCPGSNPSDISTSLPTFDVVSDSGASSMFSHILDTLSV